MTDLSRSHAAWQRRYIDWPAVNGRAGANNVTPCQTCGCLGNESCGHEPLDPAKYCALTPALVCPCCEALRRRTD